jgi:SAM-dependent methyltransferase
MGEKTTISSGELCLLCGQSADFRECDSHYDLKTKQNYRLYECQECRAQFWLPLKNPGVEWYEHDPRYASRNIDPHIKPNWNHRKIISFLGTPAGKILDVGCGTGNLLVHAREKGWEVYGIDFDRDAVKAAKEVLGLDQVEPVDLTEYHNKYPDRKFNLITFFDLFEHIDNHNQFADTIHEMLAANGYIAMSMPYRGGARWLRPHDLPPRHLTHWDRSSLQKFWERHDFTVRYAARRSEGLRFLILKLRFKYGKYTSFNLVGRLKAKNISRGVVKIDKSTKKKIGAIQILAQIKDLVIFGIPAFLIWLVMLPTAKRYITLYLIAQKNE